MIDMSAVRITDLGFGGGFSLWGLRSIVVGQGDHRTLTIGFDRAFGDCAVQDCRARKCGSSGRLALNALKSVALQMSAQGKRTIHIASPGQYRLLADELSFIAMLAAVQNGETTRAVAHMSWLLGGGEARLPLTAARGYACFCEHAGLMITQPEFNQIDVEHVETYAKVSAI